MGFKANYKGGRPSDDKVAIDRLKRELPAKIANTAVNHFKEGFRRGGGMTDKSRSGWKPRKNNTDPGRAILVKSGDLKRDVRKRKTDFRRIVVGTQNIKYADYHNNSTPRLPRREFIGESEKLNTKIERLIINSIEKAFR